MLCVFQIFGQANTPLKKWILGFAFQRKEAEMMSGIMRRNSLWDKIIFKKVQVIIHSLLPHSAWGSLALSSSTAF